MEQTQLYDGRFLMHHPAKTCKGPACPLHKPSDHPFVDLPLDWNESWGVMMRVKPDGTKVIDPDEFKVASLLPGQSVILENSAVCASCGDKVVSYDVHDFVPCSCGKIFVDGGKEYLRRGGDFNVLIDTSIVHKRESNA